MPPKKKGSGKRSAKVKSAALIDGLTKEELSKEQMIEHIIVLREELDREREERNYFQLERDKIHSFWDVTKKHLEEAAAQLRNIEKKIEEDEGRHLVEIKVYKQKMKHLLCEHHNTTSELKADSLTSTEAMQKEQARLESELHRKMAAIRLDIHELGIEYLVDDLEQGHNEEVAKTKQSLENQQAETEAQYKEKLELLQQEMDIMRKKEVSEREDQWNSHITAVTRDHGKIFDDALVLLNRNVEQDLDLTESLKKQIEEMKTKQKEKEKNLARVLPENKHLTKFLSEAKEKIAEAQRKMKNPIRKEDPIEKRKEKELHDQKQKLEQLQQKFSKLQQERDELHKTLNQSVERFQQQEDEKNMKLEQKVKALTESLEATEVKISSVILVSNVDQTVLSGATNRVKAEIHSSNKFIRDLQYKITQISKARWDLLLNLETKRIALGVPVGQLCVTYS
ncbi:dynein regulatory complex subunit 4 [Dunckerocampus dactyliophorus]|uniref:dynein regulatory complex subunit 4 n=1 Tax=Dunckerocampus dactyliophorus TaxID=161453 RepID=UPI002404E7A5|nr:dynein regulatory complex subunit 4 [Dunckerocampus dactyliophorus]